VPLGRVPRRGQGQDVAIIVDRDGIQVGVDARDHLAVPLLGPLAHASEGALGGGRHARRGKTEPHEVTDAGLARGVDLPAGELGHTSARLQACRRAHAGAFARAQRLGDAIQHVKVDGGDTTPALLRRQPGQRRRRVPVSVVGIEGVAVHVHEVTRRRARQKAAPPGSKQGVKRPAAHCRVEILEPGSCRGEVICHVGTSS